jgi:hypothetical protein
VNFKLMNCPTSDASDALHSRAEPGMRRYAVLHQELLLAVAKRLWGW